MPLPGGPSEKFGNRYELRWTIRRMIDLITGRVASMRLETPGEDCVEFRCRMSAGEEVHQAKRGVSGGRWTLRSLTDTLTGFAHLLRADPDLSCVFVSEHPAPDLAELSDRARQSIDLQEFTARFLQARFAADAWQQLQLIWNVDGERAWNYLRRISSVTVSEQHIIQEVDTLLHLLFQAHASTARAVLGQFAVDAIHRELAAADVLQELANAGIHLRERSSSLSLAPVLLPPPSSGVARAYEVQQLETLLSAGSRTIVIRGIPGIGKSTVAAQFSANWPGPVCWVDCAMFTTDTEAVDVIDEFLTTQLGETRLASVVRSSTRSFEAVGKRIGTLLSLHQCLLVWDGLDGTLSTTLRAIVSGIASTVACGAQFITAKEYDALSGVASGGSLLVDRLSVSVSRGLILAAFPDARIPELEAAEDATQGHPYLLTMLQGAAATLDLRAAVALLRTARGRGIDQVVNAFLSALSAEATALLRQLAFLGVSFSAAQVAKLADSSRALDVLASRSMIVRAGPERYQVHGIVASLILTSNDGVDVQELHQQAALFLRGLEQPTWLEVWAMLNHARAAAMTELTREAAHALLLHALNRGFWSLSKEAATSLADDVACDRTFLPHFVLGKCARMRDELDVALSEYGKAMAYAAQPDERDLALCERAAVLAELARTDEAMKAYAQLARSERASTRAESLTALGLLTARRGDVDAAMLLLAESREIARTAGLVREEAEACQSTGYVLAEAERWAEAHTLLKTAHTLRTSMGTERSADVFGWYYLMRKAVDVERALGNRDAMVDAAHGCWRFAVLSGSVEWETEAAYIMCDCDQNPDDQEIQSAIARMRALGSDRGAHPLQRLVALHRLALANWVLDRFADAFEAMLDELAVAAENGLSTATYIHCPRGTTVPPHKVLIVDEPRGYILTVPDGIEQRDLVGIITGVMSLRPELAQYGMIVCATMPDQSRSETL